jgi:hypothetical protein
MKNLISITFILSFLFCYTANVHSQKNEIYAGYGAVPLIQAEEMSWYFMFSPVFTYEMKNIGLTGVFFAGYNYKLSKLISVGVVGGYVGSTMEFTSIINPMKKLTMTFNHYLVLGRMDIHYTGDNIVDLYSGISIGYWNETQSGKTDLNNPEISESSVHLGPHINLLGIKVGKEFGGFAELGLGVSGTINLGLFGRF